MKIPHIIIGRLIEAMRQRGLDPVEIHMCQQTFDNIDGSKTVLPDNRTPLQKMRGVPAPEPIVLKEIFGLPLVVNEKVFFGGFAIRERKALGDDNWYDTSPDLSDQLPPWLRREPSEDMGGGAAQAKQSEDEPVTLKALSASPGEASSCTNVLMESFEGIDKVQDIIVIRSMKNGQLEMTATCSKIGMMGALQLAMTYVVHGD